MSNNYIPIKSPFDKVLTNKKLDRFHMGQKLVAVYNYERSKALKLAGNYSIKKINWLSDQLFKSQQKVNEMFPLSGPVSKITVNSQKQTQLKIQTL